MPTLEDWLALDLDEEDRTFLRTLHERRPRWLATGDLKTDQGHGFIVTRWPGVLVT